MLMVYVIACVFVVALCCLCAAVCGARKWRESKRAKVEVREKDLKRWEDHAFDGEDAVHFVDETPQRDDLDSPKSPQLARPPPPLVSRLSDAKLGEYAPPAPDRDPERHYEQDYKIPPAPPSPETHYEHFDHRDDAHDHDAYPDEEKSVAHRADDAYAHDHDAYPDEEKNDASDRADDAYAHEAPNSDDEIHVNLDSTGHESDEDLAMFGGVRPRLDSYPGDPDDAYPGEADADPGDCGADPGNYY